MFAALAAIAITLPQVGDVAQPPLWIEGETPFTQFGSTGLDRPPFGSRGACLGSDWGDRKGDFATYRFHIDEDRADAVVYLRYARNRPDESYFQVLLDQKTVAERLVLKPTGGWGHLRNDEWRSVSVQLGLLAKGWHALKLVSLAAKNNTNLDGFFLAGAEFQPLSTRSKIEAVAQPRGAQRRDPNAPACVAEDMGFEDIDGYREDWYYPAEEPSERAALAIPSLHAVAERKVSLAASADARPENVPVGGAFQGWRVAETLTEPEPMAVLEREFDRWGLIVYLGRSGVVAEIRKAVGRLDRISPPKVVYPRDYFQRILEATEDVQGVKLLGAQEEPTFEKVFGFLAPLQSYVFLGSPNSTKKLVVRADGTIGILPLQWGGNKPLSETFLDPLEVFPAVKPDGYPLAVKRGLLGGHLPAIDYGFLDASGTIGWEMCALMDVGESETSYVRIRRTDGREQFYQLAPLEPLDNGRPFYASLLKLYRWWEEFFADGMQIEINDRRVQDASKAAIAWALSGYAKMHPKYGMGGYWGRPDHHDGFPPTTHSLNTCLLDWGFHQAAKDRLGYYFDYFVQDDGTLKYYGPAVAEYGELLDLAATCVRKTGDLNWFDKHRPAIDRMAEYLLTLRVESLKQSPEAISYGLLFGAAEADNCKQPDYFFSGAAWAWRGLREIGRVYFKVGLKRNDDALKRRGEQLLDESEKLREDTLRAVKRSIVTTPERPFLPPTAEFDKPFQRMTQDRFSDYTNYRYWPETLSAGCLPPELERMMINYRVFQGGEFLAMTRFKEHLDDWPYYHYARSLLAHRRVPHFLLGYFGHLAHHQMPGTFVGYEQVLLKGFCFRREYADYCVPAQVTIPMMTRWLLAFENRDNNELWLGTAMPEAWLTHRVAFRNASTRWGPVSLEMTPSRDRRAYTARIELPSAPRPAVVLRVRHPDRLQLLDCSVEGGRCESVNQSHRAVRLMPEAGTMIVTLKFGQ